MIFPSYFRVLVLNQPFLPPIIEVAQVQQSRPERIKCWLAWSPNRWVTKTNTFCWLKWNFYWFDVGPCCIVLPASRMNSSHVILTMKPTVNLAINPICEQAGALPCTNLIVVELYPNIIPKSTFKSLVLLEKRQNIPLNLSVRFIQLRHQQDHRTKTSVSWTNLAT
jgi:hypothetical protein